MKKRGRRSRLFLCFRPLFVDDNLRPTKKFKFPTDEEDSGSDIIKEKHCHRFSGALKSVMSDLFMTKRLGSKRFRSKSLRSPSSKISSALQNNKLSKTMSETISFRRSSDRDDIFKSDSSSRRSSSTVTTTNGGSGSLVSSTASSFSSNSNSVLRRNGSFEANLNESKQVQQQKKNVTSSEFFSTNIGLSLIVLSLFVLIVYGKICAILCTSTWLLLMSARFKEGGVVVEKSSTWDDQLRGEDVYSGEYKKRVIMEGLLDRNRSRGSSRRLESKMTKE